MDYVPNFEWILRGPINGHSQTYDFPLSYHMDAIPEWPALDMTVASCYPSWTLGTIGGSSWDGDDDEQKAVTIPTAAGNPSVLRFQDNVYGTAAAISTYPKQYTVDIRVKTQTTWYDSTPSGTGTVEDTQTFTVTINEPCTQQRPAVVSAFAAISTSVGTSTTMSRAHYSSKHTTHSSECALTYTFDAAGECSSINCSLNTSGDLSITVNPSDNTANIGVYYVEMTVCYTNYPETCAIPE